MNLVLLKSLKFETQIVTNSIIRIQIIISPKKVIFPFETSKKIKIGMIFMFQILSLAHNFI